ncbi:WYL domain-containing protein [Nocardioides cavernaquae]|uniref:WYL domain-containing protein n=1 Tax=Nocardioides cavernaquae TaxID=2321396 RepID=A0A3A5H732_9ACTN|nr:WYL domain-containing protein [Nocardioides cavernaquae]RJS46463.1 WYL domain-containing protein [Nocardioides cavernaquae]
MTGGRDQRGPMERLVGLAALLRHAGPAGEPAANLLAWAGWHDAKDGISQLQREFRHLNSLGWRIENIGPVGEGAIYRMTTVDNRLKIRLTPEQQTALRRAVLLVDREDLAQRLDLKGDSRPSSITAVIDDAGHDHSLATVIGGLRNQAIIRFRYNGSVRVVHPDSVRTQQTRWYLFGREGDGEKVKAFVISRMSDVHTDPPGTAQRHPDPRRTGLHPMSWEVDPPVEVTLSSPDEYVADVRRWLSAPTKETSDGTTTELVYRVTNRSALRARIYQLGTRVRIVGPADVRDELIDELQMMAGL